MAYVGTPIDTQNQFQSLVGKRFCGDASTTGFTLDVAPTSTLDIEVFVENVRQAPNSAYSLSGTTLTFAAAPPSGTNNIYVVHQAKAVGTISPAAGTVNADSFDNTVISGHTALAAIPDTTDELLISDAGTIKRIDFSLLGNAPAFKATSASSQAITENSNNLVVLGTEVFDTDSAFASNKFTVPSGKAGKYFFIGGIGSGQQIDDGSTFIVKFHKNGSEILDSYTRLRGVAANNNISVTTSAILDLSASDYIELYFFTNNSDTNVEIGGNAQTFMSGFRLIGI